jgi:hypothetical protein
MMMAFSYTRRIVMKTSALKYSVLTWMSSLTILIILLVPFHAFLTVWGSSVMGHYTLLRLWKEILLVICGIGVLFLLCTDHKIRSHTLSRRLVWLISGYALVQIIWGLIAVTQHEVSAKALGYGLISNLRFLAFFLITWAVSLRLARMRSHWQWIVLWPAAIVIIFGLLQVFILPHNFLTHFGYGLGTIDPYETINHNHNYIRIASTLRGPNPLGAYLLLPISMLGVLLLQKRLQRRQAVLLVAALGCLFFSFSRSAWLGAVITLVIAASYILRGRQVRRIALITVGCLALVTLVSIAFMHDNSRFQNFVFHTEDRSTIKTSSNDGHVAALEAGARDIAYEPLGRGPGTAGPASVYNAGHPTRIAENYFLQIGQETGVVGLILFLLINVGVGYLLWLRRSDSLALALFASFLGLTFVNLLSHAWADDTLAYIWWGLAGIAMAPNLKEERNNKL